MVNTKIRHIYDNFHGDYKAVASFRVKHRHIFDNKYFYVLLREWLIENDWVVRKNSKFPETFMLKRETMGKGDEYWWHWRLSKNPIGPGGSDFWRWEMHLHTHILDIKDVEVMHNGQKYKLQSGDVEVKVRTFLVWDYKRQWEKNWFLRSMKKWFVKRVLKKQLITWRDALYNESYRFQEAMKTYLKLRTHLSEPELNRFYKTKELDNV